MPEDPRVAYRLCPRCLRAVPVQSGERYCVNDGTRLLEHCPACGAGITSPYSRYCAGCGQALAAHAQEGPSPPIERGET